MSSEVEIREGFLCPICMQDLGTVNDLQQHFDDSHAGEDKAVIQQLKGLFGKAKRKILGKDRDDEYLGNAFGGAFGQNPDSGNQISANIDVVSGIDPTLWDPQEFGQTRSHTDSYKSVRDKRIDRFVVETNKLVIRLDKLVNYDCADPGKRKAFEKSVVPWAPDADVKLCTTCGKSFTLTRRRHHCRLCGGIMCNKCSQFLSFSYAKKLTNPAFQYDGEGFHRSSSNSSLNSIMSPEGEPHIRTCTECRTLIERRDQLQEQRNTKPMIVQLYEKMKTYMVQTEEMHPEFVQRVDLLRSGETTYNLAEVQRYRVGLLKLYEAIDALSKRIVANGLSSPDPPGPRALYLQKSIRINASNFLQANMLSLQSLPNEAELVQLREAKNLEIRRKIEAEQREKAEREMRRKEEQRRGEEKERPKTLNIEKRTSPSHSGSMNPVTTSGWKPMEVSTNRLANSEDDPMIQQINIIKGYIKQAKQAHKFDEVHMLEENLKDLQREFWNQKQQQNNTQR